MLAEARLVKIYRHDYHEMSVSRVSVKSSSSLLVSLNTARTRPTHVHLHLTTCVRVLYVLNRRSASKRDWFVCCTRSSIFGFYSRAACIRGRLYLRQDGICVFPRGSIPGVSKLQCRYLLDAVEGSTAPFVGDCLQSLTKFV